LGDDLGDDADDDDDDDAADAVDDDLDDAQEDDIDAIATALLVATAAVVVAAAAVVVVGAIVLEATTVSGDGGGGNWISNVISVGSFSWNDTNLITGTLVLYSGCSVCTHGCLLSSVASSCIGETPPTASLGINTTRSRSDDRMHRPVEKLP
jgi:hypothetical protein